MGKEETTLPFDVSLLKKGFFVSISFVSLRKGVKKRTPEEELEATFRELNDYALPEDVRRILANLIARRQYLYNRYAIPIPSMKGHYVPVGTLGEFLEKTSDLERDVGGFVEEIVRRREEINRRLAAFNERYAKDGAHNGHLPDDPKLIRSEYGKFTVRVNSMTVATADLLNSIPELKATVKSELLEEANRHAKQLESEIRAEVSRDLKLKVSAFLRRLAEVKSRVEKEKKPIHGNTIKALGEDIERLSSLTAIDPELASLMGAVKGLTQAVIQEGPPAGSPSLGRDSATAVPAHIEAFEAFAAKISGADTAAKRPRPRSEADEELLAAMGQVARMIKAK